MDSDLKLHNSFRSKNNRKATHSFAPRLLIFKLQQEVVNLNDIWVGVILLPSQNEPLKSLPRLGLRKEAYFMVLKE